MAELTRINGRWITSVVLWEAIDRLKREERYRVFADLERDAARFPLALWRPPGEEDAPRPVTVWCSNDYLGMGIHPAVIAAGVKAAEAHGAGAGGTRNISGTHHPIVMLERELAYLHGKEAALVFTSGWISLAGRCWYISTIAQLLPDCLIFVRRAQPQFDDRGRPSRRLRQEGLLGDTTSPTSSKRCWRPSRSSAPS